MPNVTSRNGLRAEMKAPASKGRREDLRGVKREELEIVGIGNRGDILKSFGHERKRRAEQSSRGETAVAITMAGDWLSDVEIEALVNAGEFDGDFFPLNPVSGGVFVPVDEYRAQEAGRDKKRQRLDASSSGAGKRAESIASARDYVADDDLEQGPKGGDFGKEA